MASREEFVQDQNGSRELDRRYQNDFSRRKYVCLGVIAGIGVVLTVIGCTLIILYMTRNGQPTQTSPHGDQTEYIATEQVNTVQACYGSHDKQTFPDIGYALMGYNIFKGYPQAAGHDPGFTYPIFKANYSENSFSSDCRYLMPTGLVALPDMSCVTSFSSKTVKTERDFSESLHQSAEVSGSVWGSSFSLSEDYHRTVSEISTGNYVYILSSATCSYYFVKLLKGTPQIFDPTFIKWAERLNSANDEQTYFEFFNTYGTHFPTEVTFGARYLYQNKVTSKYFQSKTESGIDVAAAANFAGLIKFGVKVSEKHEQMASDFMNNVETQTITVGAPPPVNGDAMTWASTVKDNPLPSFYSLESIENLFSEVYMANMNLDLTGISEAILKHKTNYCLSLSSTGKPDVCNSSVNGLVFRNTNIRSGFAMVGLNYPDCIDSCLKDSICLAINYCNGCNESDRHYGICYKVLTIGGALQEVKEDFMWISVFFIKKFTEPMMLNNTVIVGSIRSNVIKIDITVNSNPTECYQDCFIDPFCDAYMYDNICRLFKAEDIIKFQKHENVTSYIMPDRRERLNGESVLPLKHELSKYFGVKQQKENN